MKNTVLVLSLAFSSLLVLSCASKSEPASLTGEPISYGADGKPVTYTATGVPIGKQIPKSSRSCGPVG